MKGKSTTAKSEAERLRLPAGLSPADEARWWDEHKGFWRSVEMPDEVRPPQPARRTEPVMLRLPVEMTDHLKREAAKRSLSYQTLIRLWLQERLDSSAVADELPQHRS